MTYCPKCKKWSRSKTIGEAVLVDGKPRQLRLCKKSKTIFIPDGKKSKEAGT